MNYSELKPIFDKKTFDILANLTDNPTCDIYLPNLDLINDNIFDPFDTTAVDATDVIHDDNIYIATIRCIYTYDKILVQSNDSMLGSTYTLVLYVRADDIPSQILDKLNNIIIKFNNILYNVNTHLNLYNILYEFNLK